jgi:hypothetical protein
MKCNYVVKVIQKDFKGIEYIAGGQHPSNPLSCLEKTSMSVTKNTIELFHYYSSYSSLFYTDLDHTADIQ